MIFEFALDPQEVATWGQIDKYRQVAREFGVGTPKIVTRLPKRWKRLVWEAFGGGSAEEEARLTEVIAVLSELQVRRPHTDHRWEDGWLPAIRDEHDLMQFHAILSIGMQDDEPYPVYSFNDLHPLNPKWNLAVSSNFTRCAAGFRLCFEPMLKLGSKIRLVDANVRPHLPRCQNVFGQLLEAVNSRPKIGETEVQLICKNSDQHTNWNDFERSFRNWPKNVIPNGMKIEIVRLEEIGCARFHDRLVLTEFGGAFLPDGLDEEDNPVENAGRASLLNRSDYSRSWNIFQKEGTDFRLENSFVLTGE